jgi:Flp pilus assembly protein TadD
MYMHAYIQGNNALLNVQPELAVNFFERANNMAPKDTNIMDALADVHLQLDNQEEALVYIDICVCIYLHF